jgi:hypothetical protein
MDNGLRDFGAQGKNLPDKRATLVRSIIAPWTPHDFARTLPP